MKYHIRQLTPNLVEDYIRFFDTEDHSDEIPDHKCYCVCWASDDHRGNSDKMSSAEKRRELARVYVMKGLIKGYLAYEGDRVIGWVNANDKSQCRYSISWLRNLKDVSFHPLKDEKFLSVFCFTIAKAYRRQGLATKLLEAVINDAKKRGYKYVEAYPKKKMSALDAFEGPLNMYKKFQFFVDKDYGDFLLVRKEL
jgi:ribosomal protein S18 acetylase RimI-like enzyme